MKKKVLLLGSLLLLLLLVPLGWVLVSSLLQGSDQQPTAIDKSVSKEEPWDGRARRTYALEWVVPRGGGVLRIERVRGNSLESERGNVEISMQLEGAATTPAWLRPGALQKTFTGEYLGLDRAPRARVKAGRMLDGSMPISVRFREININRLRVDSNNPLSLRIRGLEPDPISITISLSAPAGYELGYRAEEERRAQARRDARAEQQSLRKKKAQEKARKQAKQKNKKSAQQKSPKNKQQQTRR